MYPGITTSRLGIDWKKRGKDMKKERIFWGLFFIVGNFSACKPAGVPGGHWLMEFAAYGILCRMPGKKHCP